MILNFESFLNESRETDSNREQIRSMSAKDKVLLCKYMAKKKIPVQGFRFDNEKSYNVHFNNFVQDAVGIFREIYWDDESYDQFLKENFFRIKFSRSIFGYPLELLDLALVDNYDYSNLLKNFKTFSNSDRYGL